MYLSLNWLKDFVHLPKKVTPEELAMRLTLHTVEIEGVMKQADKYDNVVVGKILEIKKHPNADRLQLAKVDIKNEKLEVVCGAPNIAVGQLVPVALVGATLPNGLEIKEAEVRGVKSSGMICAPDELGLGDDHSGILILEKKAKVGQKFADYLELKDIVFEVDNKSITNRPDLWSHMGMARDISAFLKVKFTPYAPKPETLTTTDNSVKLKVSVADQDLCPRYMAIAIDGIKIEPSPSWMQERLVAANMRPINNIVDITNYVMLELGQPLHAFDLKLVPEIMVRRAKKGEAIETLDGAKHELGEEMLMITDGQKPIAVAGVMGGANSEISNDTTSIIIESANFNPISVRKTAQKLNLRTESSMRFEKSLDPNLCELALARTVELAKQICPNAKVVSNLVDEKKFELNLGPIILTDHDIYGIIGEKLKKHRVEEILTDLGFRVNREGHTWRVMIPTWRATKDVSIKEDLIEEVARIYGYDNLLPSMPKLAIKSPEVNIERRLERKIKNIFSIGAGFSEVYNYSFVGEEQLKKLGMDYKNYIRLANPISNQYTMLRQNLTANLLGNVRVNQARFEKIKLYEIGNIYLSGEGELNKNNTTTEKLPYQEKRLGIVIAASKAKEAYEEIKGAILYLVEGLNFNITFEQSDIDSNWADNAYTTQIMAGDKKLGWIAKLDTKIAKNNGIKKEACVAELYLGVIMNFSRDYKNFQEFDRYPSVSRDLALIVDEKTLYKDISGEISKFDELIKEVELFDVYEGGKLGEGKKSLAFHIVYQADKTLTSEEVDNIQKELIKNLEEKFDAKIRDF